MPVTQLPPAEVRRDPLSERDRGVTPGLSAEISIVRAVPVGDTGIP
jgi:hypothetical protein